MSNTIDNTKKADQRGNTPLGRFLNPRPSNDTTQSTSTENGECREPGVQQDAPSESDSGTERSTSRASTGRRFAEYYVNTKPERSQRKRHPRPVADSTQRPDKTPVALPGMCLCGEPFHPVYEPRCENCFADACHTWHGLDKSVTLKW